MSKEEKPILNLRKGCPFCGNTDLCYGYDSVLNRVDIVCKACKFTFIYKIEKPTNALLFAEGIWNSRADEEKPTAESTAEAILSELKSINTHLANMKGYVVYGENLKDKLRKETW
jgi:hypothetical protein